jgi:predicted acetyltransferase
MKLVVPSLARLPAYEAALRRGFWSDNLRREQSRDEELARIAADPAAFVASLADRAGRAGPITLSDGTQVRRLPGFRRWMWDETGDDGSAESGFCGSIGFRWQPGTAALPDYVLGHIGYAVVPWKQRRGYASKALGLMLAEARKEGLPYVELTTDPDNEASQKVITANGGVFVERFRTVAGHGGKEELRWRIAL